jgi:hypothetical protein
VSDVRCPDGVRSDGRSAASRAQTLVGKIRPADARSERHVHSPAANVVLGIVRQSRRSLFDPCRRQRQLQVLQQRGHPGPCHSLRWMQLHAHWDWIRQTTLKTNKAEQNSDKQETYGIELNTNY